MLGWMNSLDRRTIRYLNPRILPGGRQASRAGNYPVTVAEVPALPGCVSQGETVEKLRANVREAIEGWLLAEDGELKPGATDRVLEVTV